MESNFHIAKDAKHPKGAAMSSMTIPQFNAASADEADSVLRPCLDIDRWVEAVLAGRPYADRDRLVETAQRAAEPFTAAEVEAALAHHPRIGERARGGSPEAGLSRGEQAGLSLDDDLTARLARGNAEYERRFDRVFLIRAAGRTTQEILEQLEQRLTNDEATESAVVADQLRQIAVLRLKGAVTP